MREPPSRCREVSPREEMRRATRLQPSTASPPGRANGDPPCSHSEITGSVLAERWPTGGRAGSILAEARPDPQVAAEPVLEVDVPEHTLAQVPGALGHPLGRGVLDVDPQLEPDQAELVEAPARQELHRARRDAAAPGGRRDHVAELAFAVLQIEVDQPREAQEAVVTPADREPRAAPVL